MDNNTKLLLAVGLAATPIAIARFLETHAIEVQKRKEIKSNTRLDIQAIHTATDVMTERIDRGEIRSLSQLADTLHNEIAFHKIAIREE